MVSKAASLPAQTAHLDPALAASIGAAMHGLAAPRRQIEDAFVAIGRDLIEGNKALQGITDVFAGLAGTLEAGSATDGVGLFQALAGRVLAMTGSMAGDTRDLGPLIEQIEALRRPVGELKRAVSSVGQVAINTRISAAQLPRGRSDFEAFTVDIVRLAEQAADSVGTFARVYERLADTLGTAEAKRAALEATQRRTLFGLKERLEESLAAAVERARQASLASGEIGELFSRISAGIASIVMALQIGDITRQRIEHVETGLAFLLDPDQSAEYAPGGNHEALVAAVCRLESAQAAQAAQDFERDVDRTVEAIHQLAADTEGIVANGRRIHEDTVKASQTALAGLAEEVRRACALMRENETSRAELDEAALAVDTSLQDLLSCVKAVQSIKGGMHILGINMALKCAWLGPEGNTLNVIAHELRELAASTVTHANAAVSAINEAVALAQAMTAARKESAGAEIDRLEEEVRQATRPREGDRRLAEALELLVHDGLHVADLLRKVAGRITIQQDIGGAMRGAITQLEAIRRDAEAAHAATGAGDMRADEERALAQLKGRYTMERERALHAQHAGAPIAVAAPPQASVAEASTDLDDIFF